MPYVAATHGYSSLSRIIHTELVHNGSSRFILAYVPPSITTTHFLQDTGCVAFPFVDVHPQTIAATLALSSVPEAVTQAVVVILETGPESPDSEVELRQ